MFVLALGFFFSPALHLEGISIACISVVFSMLFRHRTALVVVFSSIPLNFRRTRTSDDEQQRHVRPFFLSSLAPPTLSGPGLHASSGTSPRISLFRALLHYPVDRDNKITFHFTPN